MKIAVVTFFDNGNYGSELQAIAMNHFLTKHGHQSTFCKVKFRNKFLRSFELIINSIKLNIYGLFNSERGQYLHDRQQNILNQRMISHEMKDYIHGFMSTQLEMDCLSPITFHKDYDAYICGSDQIWSALKLPIQPMNFLYGINANKKIAYAPSVGLDIPPEYYIKEVERYIKDFKYLSVREEAAKDVFKKKLGVEAQQVLDPTMLIGIEYWDAMLAKYNKEKPDGEYVFCYFLGKISNDIISCINKVADGRKVIMIPYEEDIKLAKNAHYYLADPLDFVNYIKHASYVLTDSFHGSVFSILYSKNFVVTKRTHVGRVAQTSRITSLLNMFELQKQYCRGEEEMLQSLHRNINYELVQNILQNKQQESKAFLEGALSEIEKNIKHE